jgi:DNA-binding MarR family transcriptional regulator
VEDVTSSPVPIAAIRGLARASRLLERASAELNLSQYRVLASIAAGDERASRIADRLALGKPTISATVESLRQRGLLTRTGVDEDQRAAALRLTAEGQAALTTAERTMADRIEALASRTPDPAAVVQVLIWLDGAVDELMTERASAAERR